jgi:hypothetical protein
MNGTNDLLVVGLWFLLAGFSLGIGTCFLIWKLMLAKPTDSRKLLSYQGDLRRTVAILQQLQVLIGYEAAEGDPSLADLLHLLQGAQRDFGRTATLEGVIQTLVAQDLEQQLMARKLQRAQDAQQKTVMV